MKAQTYPAESFFLLGKASERLTLTIEKSYDETFVSP